MRHTIFQQSHQIDIISMIQIVIVTIKCAVLGDVMPSLLKVWLINLRGSLMYGPLLS
jgi:hypothetical protein